MSIGLCAILLTLIAEPNIQESQNRFPELNSLRRPCHNCLNVSLDCKVYFGLRRRPGGTSWQQEGISQIRLHSFTISRADIKAGIYGSLKLIAVKNPPRLSGKFCTASHVGSVKASSLPTTNPVQRESPLFNHTYNRTLARRYSAFIRTYSHPSGQVLVFPSAATAHAPSPDCSASQCAALLSDQRDINALRHIRIHHPHSP